jgi:hypothetical protein
MAFVPMVMVVSFCCAKVDEIKNKQKKAGMK